MSGFMQEQVTKSMEWRMIDGDHGTEYYPAEYFTMEQAIEQYPGRVYETETISGHGARLSAPGYMDCTEWAVFSSIAEAKKYLAEMYGDDEASDDE